jgi:hypothetical protein
MGYLCIQKHEFKVSARLEASTALLQDQVVFISVKASGTLGLQKSVQGACADDIELAILEWEFPKLRYRDGPVVARAFDATVHDLILCNGRVDFRMGEFMCSMPGPLARGMTTEV